jgi:TetR/AcrR family transcriptional regulator, mexJK operon transcriptional repressor
MPEPADPHTGQPAKREAITEAARRVFLEHGYSYTSVDAIATEAGVSKQTIYNHFGDKERLFRAVMEDTLRSVGAGTGPPLGDALADSDDFERDLRAFGRLLARGALREEVAALRRLLMAELDRHPELLEVWGNQGRQLLGSVTQAIERQAERGVLDVANPALAADQLFLLTAANALTHTTFGLNRLSDAELGKLVDDGLDLWFAAYRAERPRTASRRRSATRG